MKRKIVRTKSEYVEFIKTQNNRTNVYTTVYDFSLFAETAKVESSVILDRVFFDFDAHESNIGEALEDLKIVLGYVRKYQHTIFFSGRGFHLFVFGENAESIRGIQAFFREVKNHLALHHYANAPLTLDERVGQTTRLRRVPNTVNLASDNGKGIPYYCIPIFKEDIELGIEHILETAMSPRLIPRRLAGGDLISWPDMPPIELVGDEVKPVNVEGRLPILPCLYNAIMVENPSHMARVYLVSWYRDLLTQRQDLSTKENKEKVLNTIVNEIEKLVQSSDEVWLDWDKETTRKHARFTVFGNYNSPNCKSKLIPEGYCVGKCWRYPDYLDKEE